ncbi:MAG: membrane protein insertion efficiency factor YidD [Bacteroidales bacterium]|nr:membrane protein insertion efficiency factor YidD [Bacteroidales bacterium]
MSIHHCRCRFLPNCSVWNIWAIRKYH